MVAVGLLDCSVRRGGQQVAHSDEPGKLERLLRYIARAPFALGKMQLLPDGRVRVETPPDPKTGQEALVLDALASSINTAFTG